MIGSLTELIHRFFEAPPNGCGRISNECALQLELAYHLRTLGLEVEFEVPLRAARLPQSTLKPKYNLDLLVKVGDKTFGIEIKVPLNGQHPETMYAVCADLEFVEALKRAGYVDQGYCLIATSDHVFWTDSGRGSPIHNSFRGASGNLSGVIAKPTGSRDTCVQLEATYQIATAWRPILFERVMAGGRYALIEV